MEAGGKGRSCAGSSNGELLCNLIVKKGLVIDQFQQLTTSLDGQLERPRFAILLDRKRLGPHVTIGQLDPRGPGALRLARRSDVKHARYAAPVRCSLLRFDVLLIWQKARLVSALIAANCSSRQAIAAARAFSEPPRPMS